MKALVIAREGRKAIVLLPGGEMRKVRARKGWQVGMEVEVRRKAAMFGLPSLHSRSGAVLWPALACAAACLVMFAGARLLGNPADDPVNPVQPLSPGQVTAGSDETPLPSAETLPVMIDSTPRPTPEPVRATPTPRPMATRTPEADRIMPSPKPTPLRDICDECGEIGHDDDECPNEKCDECGEIGHDDDDCPEEKHDD